MIETANVVLPVFALIGLGYLSAQAKLITPQGADGIMALVFHFGAPCLLMRALFDADLGSTFQFDLILTYFLPVIGLFIAAILISRAFWRQTPGEAVSIAFASVFGNTVMLGFPIALRAYGEEALASIVGIVGLHGPFLYVLGITLMETSKRDGAGFRAGAIRTLRTVLTNALLIGVGAGALINLFGLAPLPTALDQTTLFLASAAIPAGLFGLGASLPRYRLRDNLGLSALACALQLLVQPGLTFALGRWVFDLDPAVIGVATIIAAMPLGLNGYIFASFYRRAEGVAAGGIVLSNPLSLLSVTFWLLILQLS